MPAPTSFCVPRTCSPVGMPKPLKALPSQRHCNEVSQHRRRRHPAAMSVLDVGTLDGGHTATPFPVWARHRSELMARRLIAAPIVGEGTRKEQTCAHPTVLDELDAPLPCSQTSLGVLDDTGPHCGPPFGTKRPQAQILSPRLTSSQVTGLRGASMATANRSPREQKGTRGNNLQAFVG